MDAPKKRTLTGIFQASGLFLALPLVIALGLATTAQAASNTYRWVDAEGKTMYSPVPPTDPDQPYALLRDGVVVQQFIGLDKPEKPDSEFAEQRRAEEAQRKADNLLLVQFGSVEDIDQARDAELVNLRYDFNLLDGTWESLRKSLNGLIGVAADRQRAGLTVPRHELEQIEAVRKRMQANREARLELDGREKQIRGEYDAKKQRFQRLSTEPAAP